MVVTTVVTLGYKPTNITFAGPTLWEQVRLGTRRYEIGHCYG